jgi:hypothetical protein
MQTLIFKTQTSPLFEVFNNLQMCQNLKKQTKNANPKSWNSKPKLNLYKSLKTHQNPMNIIFLQNVKTK